MNELDIRFHGICTHLDRESDTGVPHRVVLLQCDDAHRPLLDVPPDTQVDKTGQCECITSDQGIYRLNGVRVSLRGATGGLQRDGLWDCGVPKLKTQLCPELGEAKKSKVKDEPPVGVAVWVDVHAGTLGPYVSLKGAVAVRLQTTFGEQRPVIEAY